MNIVVLPEMQERIQRVIQEEVRLAPYDPRWPLWFQAEKQHLQACLPKELIQRIEHFGSTAVPGLSAKPIIDILVGVTSLRQTRARIVPLLESQGYEYFWRPTHGDDGPPWYAWFIRRNSPRGTRTHHLHFVEADFTEHWDRLLFRDYLIEHPQVAWQYQQLKASLASQFPRDRVSYTQKKTEFITSVTQQAKRIT